MSLGKRLINPSDAGGGGGVYLFASNGPNGDQYISSDSGDSFSITPSQGMWEAGTINSTGQQLSRIRASDAGNVSFSTNGGVIFNGLTYRNSYRTVAMADNSLRFNAAQEDGSFAVVSTNGVNLVQVLLPSRGGGVSNTGQYHMLIEYRGPKRAHVSNDYGNTFTSTVLNVDYMFQAEVSGNGQVMIAGSRNALQISTDYGVTWTSKSVTFGNVQDAKNIASSYTGQYILATGQNGAFTSNDYGNTFTLVAGSSNSYFKCAGVSGEGQSMFFVGGNSIYRSVDFGATFSIIYTAPSYFSGLAVSRNTI